MGEYFAVGRAQPHAQIAPRRFPIAPAGLSAVQLIAEQEAPLEQANFSLYNLTRLGVVHDRRHLLALS